MATIASGVKGGGGCGIEGGSAQEVSDESKYEQENEDEDGGDEKGGEALGHTEGGSDDECEGTQGRCAENPHESYQAIGYGCLDCALHRHQISLSLSLPIKIC